MADIDARQMSLVYGRLLRELRKQRQLTQQQLSDMTGIKREYISLIEQGRIDMQMSTFLTLSRALGLTLNFEKN